MVDQQIPCPLGLAGDDGFIEGLMLQDGRLGHRAAAPQQTAIPFMLAIEIIADVSQAADRTGGNQGRMKKVVALFPGIDGGAQVVGG